MGCYTYKGKTYTKEELLAIKNQIIAENETVFNQIGSEALNDVNVLIDQLVKNGLAEEVIVGNTQTLLDVLDEEGASEGLKRQFQQEPERQIILNGQGVTVRTLPEDVSVINGFYSPIEKRLAETKIDKQSANKWLSVIGKGDEATWTGVKAWLEEKNPQEQVTKSEIQQWMKDNRIEISEVVKTELRSISDNPDEMFKNGELILEKKPNDGINYVYPYNVVTKEGKFVQEVKNYEDAINNSTVKNEARTINKRNENIGIPKFSQYQLEGEKENYKEVLVTLPAKPLTFEEYKTESAKGGVVFGSDERARESYNDYLKEPGKDVSKSANFLSRHFDEPNILVHLRMNTRTDSEGKKVLFLEEVQSDWGQKGKKEGFKVDSKERESLIDAMVQINERYNRGEISKEDALKQLTDNERKLSAIDKTIGDSLIPSAPFVTDTNAWTKLGLKVALKEAVKQGADKIAWTTGEQQNDRYDLSKTINEINWKLDDDQTYQIDLLYKDGKTDEIVNIKPSELENYIGKELASKILNESKTELDNSDEAEGTLSNVDLKVGGKGMKGFYGSPTERSLGIVGNVAKSLFKQEPKTINISTGIDTSEKEINWTEDSDGIQIVEVGGDRVEFDTEKEAQDYINKLKSNITTQHSIDITPELKSQVEEGLPLFQKEPVKLIPTGFVKGKKVYINSDVATIETPIHEFAHLYNAWLKENKAELYNRGLELVRAELKLGEKNTIKKAYRKGEKKDSMFFISESKDYAESFKDKGNLIEIDNIDIGNVLDLTDIEYEKTTGNEVVENLQNKGVIFTKEEIDNIKKSNKSLEPLFAIVNYSKEIATAVERSGFNSMKQIETNSQDKMGWDFSKSATSYFILSTPKVSEIQSVIDYVKSTQPNLQGEAFEEEVLTQLTGKKGLELLQSKKKGGIIDWIKEALAEIANMLGLSNYSIEQAMNMTIDEFAKAIAVDLLQGNVITSITPANKKAFNKGVEEVQKNADEYKKLKNIKPSPLSVVYDLDTDFSKEISEQYDLSEIAPKTKEVLQAYGALEFETIEQYNFILSKGLNVERWTGEGEPYESSKEMLDDLRNNNHLYFLPNDEAFGKDTDITEGRFGLKKVDIFLKDGYQMTLSEVFRVVHDYFGHGILGNQFGAIGEENATLQHLELYSDIAAPAVIFQTRGQNSWVNFSGANTQVFPMFAEARKLKKQGKLEESKKVTEEASNLFKFATPKDNILNNLYNFKKYETVRRIQEQRALESQRLSGQNKNYLDPRGKYENSTISSLLQGSSSKSRSSRGVNRRSVQESRNIRLYELNVVAEYTLDKKIEDSIKKSFPRYLGNQKIYEITNGDSFREMMIMSLQDNPFKSSVTIHSAEDFSNMRMFITEDGSTGITLTKEGFLGGGWSDPNFKRPNNLAPLLILGIKEGAITAEAFHTILPDMYSNYGLKAVSRTKFIDELRPLVKNGALEDWDYKKYEQYNKGRPDIVFFIYDGGDRDTIEDNIGKFDVYDNYQVYQTPEFSYDEAERYSQIQAINKSVFEQDDKKISNQITPIGITIEEAIKRNNGNPLNLAPNGKSSILYQSYKDLGYSDAEAERLTAQTFSDSFIEWFGDWQNDPQNASKVTDENGQPLIVFRGLKEDFKVKEGYQYFAKNKDYTRSFGKVTTTPAFLNIKNILDLEYFNKQAKQKGLYSFGTDGLFEVGELFIKNKYEFQIDQMFLEGMEDAVAEFEDKFDNGDGIVGYDSGFYGEQIVYVTKNPNQIKSATENIGTFSPTNPDIRFQTIPTEEATTIPDCI